MTETPRPWHNDRFKIRLSTLKIGDEIITGRLKAHEKHGENSIEAVPALDIARWLPILGEEFGEVNEALTYDKSESEAEKWANVRAELIDVITVATAWVAAIDRADVIE